MRLFFKYITCLLMLVCWVRLHAQGNYSFNSTPVLNPGDDPAKKLADAVFYRIEIAQPRVFTGQPVLVQYKFYMSVLDEPSPGKAPAFTGCSIVELPQQDGPLIEMVNGKAYNVLVVRRLQVTPLQDGQLVLPEASINNVIQYVIKDSPYDIKEYRVAAFCKPVTLNVLPLPEKDKPANFSGLVGNFTLSASVDSNTVPMNDNTHLSLVIAGAGNIAAVNLPAINWPAHTQHFDATDTQRLNSDTFPVSGSKIFNVPFIGTQQGNITIPPVSFSYFDPSAEKYVTLQSDSLHINFTAALPPGKEKEIITGDITNRKYLWIVPAIALVVAFVLVITGKKQRAEKKWRAAEKAIAQQAAPAPPPAAIVTPPINIAGALQTLQETGDDAVFFNQAKVLLTSVLQQKFKLAATNDYAILTELQVLGINSAALENTSHLYRLCNMRLYAPMADEGERILVLEKLVAVIEALEL
jgi:hypothetical protein